MKNKSKNTLFGDLEEFTKWKKEWQGMPQFAQNDLSPYQSILVHFDSKENVTAFAKLIEQKITTTTRYIWFPKAEIARTINRRYIDDPNTEK